MHVFIFQHDRQKAVLKKITLISLNDRLMKATDASVVQKAFGFIEPKSKTLKPRGVLKSCFLRVHKIIYTREFVTKTLQTSQMFPRLSANY